MLSKLLFTTAHVGSSFKLIQRYYFFLNTVFFKKLVPCKQLYQYLLKNIVYIKIQFKHIYMNTIRVSSFRAMLKNCQTTEGIIYIYWLEKKSQSKDTFVHSTLENDILHLKSKKILLSHGRMITNAETRKSYRPSDKSGM